MWHLLRMPAWFLTARDATSLGYRVQITQQIAGVLSGELAVALMAVFTSVFFLLVMFILSPILALVSFFGFMTVVLLILRVASERTQVRQRQAREKEVGANLIGTSIRVLDTLKATGNENIAFDRSYSSLGRLLSLGNSHLWAWMGMIPIAVTLFTTVFVLTVGALLVIIGSITQGTLAAFFLLLAGFLAPLIILVPSIDSFLSLRGALEQLDDILLQKVDPALSDPYVDGESDNSTVDFDVYIVASTHVDGVTTDDFDAYDGHRDGQADNGTVLNETWNSTSWAAAWNTIEFNSDGRAWILTNQGSEVAFCVYSKEDYDNGAPANDTREYLSFGSQLDANKPYLNIAYTP